MKESELAIGDIVCKKRPDDGKFDTYIVSSLYGDGHAVLRSMKNGGYDVTPISAIYSVKLTERILRDSGWVDYKGGFGYFKEDMNGCLGITIDPAGDIHWTLGCDRYIMPIQAVHQLQHLMRWADLQGGIVIKNHECYDPE